MQCKSCDSQIDPKWKYATDKNICPFCGKEIMDIELRDVFDALREVLVDSLNSKYSNQVKDWLHSNCGLVLESDVKNYLSEEDKNEFIEVGYNKAKIELKNSYLGKIKNESDESEINKEKGLLINKPSDERASEFMRRAGVTTEDGETVVEKTQRLKSQRIQAKSKLKELVGQIQGAEESDSEIQEPLEDIKLYSDDFENNDDSSSDDITLDDEDVPAHVMAMAGLTGKNTNANPKDLISLHKMQSKKRSSFRSGKNGFSRA